ncbi:MAG: Pvc16 family protein [Pyrinomonadaceae bacterium]
MTYLAIGTVTKSITELLTRKMNKPPLLGSSTPKVTALPPDDDRLGNEDGVNLYLYKVSQSPFASNMDWRGDRSNAARVNRPPLSLSLHYILTAYAHKGGGTALDDVTSHQLLGNAMAVLHEHPVLNDVHDADFDAALDTQFPAELRDSFEKIKLSLVPSPPLEELTKIWAGVNKAYRLSVAYEVSLVQIAPVAPAKQTAPPVLIANLALKTTGAPAVVSVEPASGPAGALVKLKGSNLSAARGETLVAVGDTVLSADDLVLVTPDEITLRIPEAPQRGPVLPVVVSVNGRESAAVNYTVRPWLKGVQPLRGTTDVPVTLLFDNPTNAPFTVEIDGKPAALTTDPATGAARATVPASITTNGPKAVVVISGGRRSNARFYEVTPSVQSFALTTPNPQPRTVVTVNGQRLAGEDVTVKYGELVIRKGPNATPAQVSVMVPRTLPPGQPVSVIVDGRESNVVPPVLESVEPAQVSTGETVTLVGRGFGGQSVAVRFGATSVAVGANASSTRLSVKVPRTLAPGAYDVKVWVNGSETNAVSLKVLA